MCLSCLLLSTGVQELPHRGRKHRHRCHLPARQPCRCVGAGAQADAGTVTHPAQEQGTGESELQTFAPGDLNRSPQVVLGHTKLAGKGGMWADCKSQVGPGVHEEKAGEEIKEGAIEDMLWVQHQFSRRDTCDLSRTTPLKLKFHMLWPNDIWPFKLDATSLYLDLP